MSYRHTARRRFLRRTAPLVGTVVALHQWNGDAYRSQRVLDVLNSPTRVSVRPAGTDGPWQELPAVTGFEYTETPPPTRTGTGIRTMLRGLLAGRYR